MRGWGLAVLLGALAIGTSRVIAGVHYPSDVLGAVFVGAVCATVSLQAERPLRPVLDLVLQIAQRLRLARVPPPARAGTAARSTVSALAEGGRVKCTGG